MLCEQFFESGEVIACPRCTKDMKAPCRAPSLRCGHCKKEIQTRDRKLSPGDLVADAKLASCSSPDSQTHAKQPKATMTSPTPNGKSSMVSPLVLVKDETKDAARSTTQKGKRPQNSTGGHHSPNSRTASRVAPEVVDAVIYDKPLSLDYIADRLDIDNPLNGYMVRDRRSGWLQGFVLLTTFTTWQRWFRWDSLARQSGLNQGAKSSNRQYLDTGGRLSALLESEKRSGDPEKEGVIWPRIAELSLLGALKCGRMLVQLAIDMLECENTYDYLILQATDQSRVRTWVKTTLIILHTHDA